MSNTKTIVDMTGEIHVGCTGRFKETSIHDDMDGVLHCSECNKKINRYIDVNLHPNLYRSETL